MDNKRVARELMKIAKEILHDVTIYRFKEVNLNKYHSATVYEISDLDEIELYLGDKSIVEYEGKFYKEMKPKTSFTKDKMNSQIVVFNKNNREIYRKDI